MEPIFRSYPKFLNSSISKRKTESFCSCGRVHIGKSSRSVKIRILEHNSCLRSNLRTHSAITEHHHQIGNQMLFDKTSVVARCLQLHMLDMGIDRVVLTYGKFQPRCRLPPSRDLGDSNLAARDWYKSKSN